CAHRMFPSPSDRSECWLEVLHHRGRRIGEEQIDQAGPRLPPLPSESHRGWIAIEQRDDDLCHDAAADGPKSIAGATNIRFAEDVVPEGRLRGPSHGIQTDLVTGQRRDADMSGHHLSRWQSDTLTSLKVTDSQRVELGDHVFAGNGNRQMDQ